SLLLFILSTTPAPPQIYTLSLHDALPISDVFQFLHPASIEQVLEQAALASPIFTTRWRWDAGRALALLRFRNGKKVPPQIQRMRSEEHTSELQSRGHLVCRLLLEKKKP